MIFILKTVWKCLTSPRLYKIYRDGPLDAMYQPQGPEKWGDKIITSANTILNISLYTSPFICLYVYKRGFCTYEECKYLMNCIGSIGCFLCFVFLLRAYGRVTNPKYMQFMKMLESTPDQTPQTYLTGVREYDFDFAAWPTSYKMPPQTRTSWLTHNPFETQANADLPLYQRIAVQMLAFIATHTFALRLIYPGSLGLIHTFLWMPLFQGRANLVQTFNGQRAKIITADGNSLDTMFVDNRSASPNGGILVICCEGNSGFYEVGIMTSPIKTGYSALGWNHPGFAESTGLPYPSQEHNAIDAVLQYAINKLNFKPENIVMFGWSIGGYSAAWAATNYPVKGLILDATFDDLLPLAQKQMPESWASLVKEVVRSYVDLDISRLLKNYSGPVQLVRRTDDEIICLSPGQCSTNRVNNLLVELIKHRHPEAVDERELELTRYANMLASKRPPLTSHEHDLLLKHVVSYMTDYKSTHCTPLPEEIFANIMNLMLTKKI